MTWLRIISVLALAAVSPAAGKLVGTIEAISPSTMTGTCEINHPEGKASSTGYITVKMAGLAALATGTISVGSDTNCNQGGGLDLNGAAVWADAM
jgi:hypothetical protein